MGLGGKEDREGEDKHIFVEPVRSLQTRVTETRYRVTELTEAGVSIVLSAP